MKILFGVGLAVSIALSVAAMGIANLAGHIALDERANATDIRESDK